MAHTASRTISRNAALRLHGRRALTVFGGRNSGPRHPLVATAMVLPLAALLLFLFGGWEAVVAQASSVGVLLGR
ncbi:hypothetical protein [Streptomyces sp. NPDC058657]|uniref:hypothetical protein n=1 Tax=unclassified Streptomyces TaxID=2593676 RepID=UPI003654796E